MTVRAFAITEDLCPLYTYFHIFIFFCKTPQPIWTKLGREGLWEEDIQICMNKIWLIPPNHLRRGIRKPKMGKLKEIKIDMLQFLLWSIIMICRFRTGWNWLWIRIMWLIGVTCLLVDCCFSELALLESNLACWYSTKWTLLCLPFERRETYCFSLIFSSTSASSQRSLSGP